MITNCDSYDLAMLINIVQRGCVFRELLHWPQSSLKWPQGYNIAQSHDPSKFYYFIAHEKEQGEACVRTNELD